MLNYRSHLPNLDSLIAFEAAARHASFTLAAEELNLTPSAVSHRVRTLEQSLETALFKRAHRSIRLTRNGSEFHSSVVVALKHLVAASDALKEESGQARLRVCTDVAFANFWLEPRLASLMNRLPDVSIDLTSSDKISDWFSDSMDVAFVLGDGEWPGYKTELLFEEEVFPICSPDYFERIKPIESAEELSRADLIDLSFDKSAWLNWTIWLAEHDVPRRNIRRVFQSNSYNSVIKAAKLGKGIALGWKQLVEESLQDQSLVIPFNQSVKTGDAHYLICRSHEAENRNIRNFFNWVGSEIMETTVL